MGSILGGNLAHFFPAFFELKEVRKEEEVGRDYKTSEGDVNCGGLLISLMTIRHLFVFPFK